MARGMADSWRQASPDRVRSVEGPLRRTINQISANRDNVDAKTRTLIDALSQAAASGDKSLLYFCCITAARQLLKAVYSNRATAKLFAFARVAVSVSAAQPAFAALKY